MEPSGGIELITIALILIFILNVTYICKCDFDTNI